MSDPLTNVELADSLDSYAEGMAHPGDAQPLHEAARRLRVMSVIDTPQDIAPGNINRWAISREADHFEPRAGRVLQASIGGRADLGYYLVFRGGPQEIADMLAEES